MQNLLFTIAHAFLTSKLSEGSICYKNVTKREIWTTQPFHAKLTF